jgi:FSR family fosmidomycin resistance protein-like MFS transporter
VLLVAGALGTLIGGHLADRVGRRPVLAVPQLVLLPAVLALPSQGLAGAFLLLVVIGVAMDANFSTALVLGQEYLPDRVGLAAGLILGVSVGIGGVVSAGLGALADVTSLETALYAVAAFPVATLALALSLPEPASIARGRRLRLPARS